MPILPDNSWLPTEVPAANATLTATSCEDLQAKINTAASAAYNNQTVHVVIPAGMTCSYGTEAQGQLSLPAKSGSGWIVVRSSGNLPPFGTRIDPSYDDQLAVFSNIAGPNDGMFYCGQYHAWRTHHYWFSGIKFTHPPIANENDVNGTASYQRTLLTMPVAGVHDVVFDRTYWHFRGYPDRGLISLFLARAYNVALLNSYFDNADIWRAYQNGITVTHTTASKNTYSGGTVYFGNASAAVGAFSVELSGSGTGSFRLYAQRDGSIKFKHNVASGLTVTCTGCTSSYDATLAVPVDAFRLMANDDSGNTAITNAQFKTGGGTSTGVPWTIQDGSDSGAGWEGGHNLYIERDVNHLVVRNNYLGATGIGVYTEGGFDDIYELEFTRNTFQSNPDLYVPTAGASNRYGYRRQHFELKTGYTVLVEGNEFLDAWVGTSGAASPAIYLANRYDITNGDAVLRDITIRNNLVVKHPACFTTSGTESTYPHNPLLRRLLIENNVCEANAFERKQFDINPEAFWYGGFRGHQIELTMGCEDCTIRHNTFYGGLGGQPSLLRLTDVFYSNLTVQDNIFFLHRSPGGAVWGEGLHARRTYADAAGVPAIDGVTQGQAALDLAAVRVPSTKSWTFDHNVIVAGCTSTASCTAETTDLFDVAAKQAEYPSGNYWPTGSTYGERIAAVGWTSPGLAESSDYSLSASSAYKGQGTAGTDPGVNWSILQEALLEEVNTEANSIFRGTVLLQGTLVVR
jgi:hypothetical protein